MATVKICDGCGAVVNGQPGWPVKVTVTDAPHPHKGDKEESVMELCRVCLPRVPGLRAAEEVWKDDLKRLLAGGRNWAVDGG